MVKMKIWVFFAAILISIVYGNNEGGSLNLWEHVVKMDQIVLSVEYNGRRLNVWKEDVQGYTRFFVTPICVMDTSSVKCTTDKYSDVKRFAFSFYVQLWNFEAAETVQRALKNKSIEVDASDIIPLPMQMVQLSIKRDLLTSEIKLDNNDWKPIQDQPNRILFELGLKNQSICKEMAFDAKSEPGTFLDALKLYFKFTMVVNQRASRNLNITGTSIAKSKMFSNLSNVYSNKTSGILHLKSDDVNDLSRDIYQTYTVSDEMTSDYIEPEKEKQIISELFDAIKGQQIQSSELSKDEWNSVFWDDIFARPDIQTEYFNETLSYDSGTDHFIYDETKDTEFRERTENRRLKEGYKKTGGGGGFSFFGIGASAGITVEDGQREGNENIGDVGSKNVTTISRDQLQTFIDSKEANVKWTGTKFEPKDLTLFRINTKTLQSSGNILYTSVVTTKLATTQELQIKSESEYTSNFNGTKKKIVIYETLQNTLQNIVSFIKSDFKSEVDKVDAKYEMINSAVKKILAQNKENRMHFRNMIISVKDDVRKNSEANAELYNLLMNTTTYCSNTPIKDALGKEGYGSNQDVERLVLAIGEGPKMPFDKNYVRLVNYMGPSYTVTANCSSNDGRILDSVTFKDGGEFAWEFIDCIGETTKFWCDISNNVDRRSAHFEVYSFDPQKKAHNWLFFNDAVYKSNYAGDLREKFLPYTRN